MGQPMLCDPVYSFGTPFFTNFACATVLFLMAFGTPLQRVYQFVYALGENKAL